MSKQLITPVLVLTLFLPAISYSTVVTVFDDLLKPNRIYLDQNYVYITERTTIFIYSLSSFNLINKFGREGEGPGEFKVPIFIIPLENRLLINSLGKITFFSKKGGFLKEVKIDGNSGYMFPLATGFAGSSYTQDKGQRFFTVDFFNSELKKIKELYREQTAIQQPGKIELFRRAFMHRTYKDLLYVTGKEGFILDCINPNGKCMFTIRRDHFKRHKIGPEDIKNADKYFKIRYGDSYEQIKNRITYPEYFPEIRSFYLVDDKIYILPYEWKENALKFYIYSINGAFLGERFIPLKMQYSMQPYPFAIKNNHLYQLVENEITEEWELHIDALNP